LAASELGELFEAVVAIVLRNLVQPVATLMYGDYLIEGDRMELDEDEDKDGEKNKYLEDNEKDRTKELWELDL